MRILIIKRGALGDVVRTSYFAAALKKAHTTGVHITWLTAPSAGPLLQFNPFVDRIVTSFDELKGQHYDHIYSLDDELETLQGLATLKTARITGAYLDGERPVYTADAAGWFDMGLLSRFGKERADQLKKENRRGHAEIFCEIFGVEHVEPMFYGDPREEQWAHEWLGTGYFTVAVNPFAGGRWPSKELREGELRRLIPKLLEHDSPDGRPMRVVLLGAGPDRKRNLVLAEEIAFERLWVAETDASPLRLAAVIGASDALISSDSLALHLGIAQRVPFVAFFAPTSADEIDTFGYGVKVVSTAQDYCSYKSDADNSTVTADRLLEAFDELIGSQTRQACQRLREHTTGLLNHG
jgi:heptosyltransferase-2